ncbi:MAG: hypothetical protein IT317_04970 [Anaerolineales bacterium]|nr:hypothetical protein [Anaerolineales bacterium]
MTVVGMANWWRVALAAGMLVSLWAGGAPGAAAQGGPTVKLDPATLEVGVGQTVDVAVAVVGVADLYAFDVALAFDPALLEVVDLDPSLDGVQAALGTLTAPGFVIRNTADNAAGTLRFAFTQLNPSPPQTGSGTLVVVRLRGKQAADAQLEVTRGDLARPDGTLMTANLEAGVVRVLAATSNAPTPTLIPSQAAGTGVPAATSSAAPSATSTATAGVEPGATGTAALVTASPTTTTAATATPTLTPVATNSGAPERTPTSTTPGETPTTPPTSAPAAVAAATASVAPSPFPTFAPTLAVPGAASPASGLTLLLGGLAALGLLAAGALVVLRLTGRLK